MTTRAAVRQEILDLLTSLRTVDGHSHTALRSQYESHLPKRLFDYMGYFGRELAYLAETAYKAPAPDDDEAAWKRLRHALERAANVTYWRHVLVTFREIFGFEYDELTDDNWRDLNDTIRRKTSEPGWYHRITTEVCSLETQVRNIPWFEDWEPEYFTGILRMEGGAVGLVNAAARAQLQERSSVDTGSLDGARQALQIVVDQYVKKGIVGLKYGYAYGRTLHSDVVSAREAGPLYARACRGEQLSEVETRALQDHFIYYIVELARERGLLMQVHTGVQTTLGHIPDSDPLLLIPLLKAFPQVKFDLFHAGYPYSREIGMLGKHYPNVYLNMAWMYVISVAASRQILAEWIDLVPRNRLIGFGSDVGSPELIYGHLVMARECMADVLADKVERDYLSRTEALALARASFRDNGMELYGLGS